ncbi:ATP-dependent RNA helicase DHX29-like [Symsagittifera roscoffensis]|uniref:ATP-dependent RNA helicase DHX29-like n=1 Tax=Symsagittifera roscoffensis TaxID=84072 RepID=UPI00307B30FD
MGASFPETLNSNLKTGECVVLNEFGSFIDGDVVVCRSPSYSPGDIRVLRGVKLPAEHPVSKLRNVILFSTSGERPDPDKMSGGDLDGDLYLVIWDKRVLQYSDTLRNIEPEKYDPPLSKPTSSKNPEDWIRENNAVVVVAETGSGKSTQVPQYLADDLFHVLGKPDDYKSPRIACTQPRRVAATKIAHRVRLEYSGSVGIESGAKLEESQPERVFNSSKASIVAYPLYASSGSEERSLNENDRLGWYENLPKDSRAGSQKNIKQEPSLDSRHSGTPAEIGGWVGFQIGSTGKSFEERKNSKKISSGTRIEFVTEGLLLNKLKTQQDSTCYDCIIVDEAHERGKDTDFLMALLRKMLQKEDCKLKVVVMSASIDEEQFSDYFFGCPVLKCRCKMYPVVEHYRPISGNLELETEAETSDDNASDVSEPSEQSDENFSKTLTKNVVHAVDVLFKDVVPNVKGDVLIFLPGKKEIHSAVDLIRTRAEKQFKSSKNSSDYVRKVVCCTNIAETSLTIPGVKFVIDAGQSKKMTYDHESRISALVLQNNSKASAKQRKGRAGRIESGFCYRLCSEADFAELEDFDDPELKQCPIDELYLYAVQVFGSIENLCLMPDAQPDDDSLLFARQRLLNLGFIVENGSDSSQEITQDGEKALSFLGELSLEDVRMIISASNHPIPIVQPALQMAILTKNYSDLTVKTSLQENDESRRMLERRNVFLDELGSVMLLHPRAASADHGFSIERRRRDHFTTAPSCWIPNLCAIVFESLASVHK